MAMLNNQMVHLNHRFTEPSSEGHREPQERGNIVNFWCRAEVCIQTASTKNWVPIKNAFGMGKIIIFKFGKSTLNGP